MDPPGTLSVLDQENLMNALRARLCLLALLAASPVANALTPGGSDFEQCGTVVQGPICFEFLADDGFTYNLEDFGPFALGDRVRVIGVLFNNPQVCLSAMCAGATNGCISGNIIEACSDPVPFCFGDGGDQMGCSPCACTNEAPPGSLTGCLNSTGVGAALLASGAAGVSSDTLRFEVVGGTANTFGLLSSADNQLPNMGPCPPGSGIQSPVLDGLRCVGGNLIRHGTRPLDAAGTIGQTTNGWGAPDGPIGGLIAQGGFVAGQTRHFAVFYREDPNLVCQSGQNTTHGVSITFSP